jgi:hypothetical protein
MRAPNPYVERDNRPLRERGTLWTPDSQATAEKRPDLQTRIYRNYLGALGLLGRVAELVPQDEMVNPIGLEQAFIDANEVMRRKGVDLFYERTNRGGFAMFDGDPLPAAKAKEA